jgi:hypothetical protein
MANSGHAVNVAPTIQTIVNTVAASGTRNDMP